MSDSRPVRLNAVSERLQVLGGAIHLRRKQLRVSATAAAESAGVSRVTWHRMENGEPSVSAGAYAAALAVLGLRCATANEAEPASSPLADADSLPLKIRLEQYPQLQSLAWQVHGVDWLSPKEAWNIYQRNWRHLEQDKLLAHEAALIQKLKTVFEEVG